MPNLQYSVLHKSGSKAAEEIGSKGVIAVKTSVGRYTRPSDLEVCWEGSCSGNCSSLEVAIDILKVSISGRIGTWKVILQKLLCLTMNSDEPPICRGKKNSREIKSISVTCSRVFSFRHL